MNVATVHPIRPELALTFDNLQRVERGWKRIDFIDFRDLVQKFLKTADNEPGNRMLMECWRDFQRDPWSYVLSRHPRGQGEALFLMALARTRED